MKFFIAHQLSPHCSWWNIAHPLVPTTWPYFEQRISLPCHVNCFSSSSAILVCLQVCWGLPLWHLPCGFLSVALLAMYPSGLFEQHVARPTPISLSHFLLYRSLPYLSAKLLTVYSSRPSDLKDVLQALIDEHLQLLLQSLGQPPSFRTMQEHSLHIWPKDSQLGLSCRCCRPPYLSQHYKCLPCLLNACLDGLISTSLLTYNAPEVREFVHLLDLLPFDQHTTTFDLHQLWIQKSWKHTTLALLGMKKLWEVSLSISYPSSLW